MTFFDLKSKNLGRFLTRFEFVKRGPAAHALRPQQGRLYGNRAQQRIHLFRLGEKVENLAWFDSAFRTANVPGLPGLSVPFEISVTFLFGRITCSVRF
jgi:hypothetical protein